MNQALADSTFTDAEIISSFNARPNANIHPWEYMATLKALNNHHKTQVIEYFLSRSTIFNLLVTTANNHKEASDDLISILSSLDVKTNRRLLTSFFDTYPPAQRRWATLIFSKKPAETEVIERVDILCSLLSSFQGDQHKIGKIIAKQLHINNDGTSGTDIKTLREAAQSLTTEPNPSNTQKKVYFQIYLKDAL